MIVHATLIAREAGGSRSGALLRGASGQGKSDLALRALQAGWALVADDRVRLWTSGGALYGRAPPLLSGLVEARGLGLLRRPALPFAAVRLVVEACEAPERLPEPSTAVLLGAVLPCVRLPLREPSSLAKLDAAMACALRGRL